MIFLKKKHVIPKQGGGGGGPPLGKNSHIFPFFLGGSFPKASLSKACEYLFSLWCYDKRTLESQKKIVQ